MDDRASALSAGGWLIAGIIASRQGLRWLLQRTVVSVGPAGVLVPGRGRLTWTDLKGVIVADRNIVLISDAPRVGLSRLREKLLEFSSDARGYRIWAMPQTQFLSTRDFIELLGQLELAGATLLPQQHGDATGLWRAAMLRLRRFGRDT